MPLLIRPVFDGSSAEAELNRWAAEIAKKFNFPVRPQLPSGDPLAPVTSGATKAAAQVEKLQQGMARFFAQADFDASTQSLDQLRVRAERAEAEFSRARAEVNQFSQSLDGIDLSQMDPNWASAFSQQLQRLGATAKQAFGDARSATEQYKRTLEQTEAAAEKADQQINKLSQQIKELSNASDLSALATDMQKIEARVKEADAAFRIARADAESLAKAFDGIDLRNADPTALKQLSTEMERLEAKSKEAEKALRQAQQAASNASANQALGDIAAATKIEKVRGVYNDMRDVFDITTVSLLGFTQAEKQAASETAYMAEKAVMVGLGMGGLPGVLTAVGIGMMGVAHWNVEAAKRTGELNKKVREAQQDFQWLLQTATMFGAKNFDFGGAAKDIGEQAKALGELKKNIPTQLDIDILQAYSESQGGLDGGGGTRVSTEEIKEATAQLNQYNLATERVHQATVAFYGQAQLRSEDYNMEMYRMVNNLQYIGKIRPLDKIEEDTARAQKEFNDLGTKAQESDKKIREINRAFSGSTGFLEAMTVAIKYNVTSQKEMEKITKENVTAHNLWSAAYSKMSGFFQEKSAALDDQKTKYDAAKAALKAFNDEMKDFASLTSEEWGLGNESILDSAGMREDFLVVGKDFDALMAGMGKTVEEVMGGMDVPKTLGDNLLGDLGRDGIEAERKLGIVFTKIKDEYVELGALPSLSEVIGDDLGGLVRDIDPVKAAIQDLFGIFTSEGSQVDLVLGGISEGLSEVGNAAAGAIGGAAAGAFGQLFDEMAANEKQLESFGKGFARKAADALRSTGSELIGDGIANELKAAAMFFIPGLQGNAAGLAAMGAAEIAAGAAMGGIGIGIGRRVGKAPEREDRESDRGAGGSTGGSRSSFETKNQAPIVVNMSGVPFGILTEREATAIGERIYQASSVFENNGGKSFPS